MKSQQPQATASATAKTTDDAKNKKQQAQAKSSGSNPTENKPKNPASATALPAKSHFTAGAEGDSEHSYRILDTLIRLFEHALQKAFPGEQDLPVVVVPGKQTDYQFNSAMAIAKV